MPGRPARRWMRRCIEEVGATGKARIPGAVCASTWKKKTERDKRAIVSAEEGRSVKKKKKKPHHKKTAHHPKRSKKRKGGKKKQAHRCGACGHAAAHGKSGCTHFASGKFCSCKHRG